MSDPRETRCTCRACGSVVMEEWSPPDCDLDYRVFCANTACPHHSGEFTDGDDGGVYWCAPPGDTRTEAEVLADFKAAEDHVTALEAARDAGDWERFHDLVVADMARRAK